MLAIEVEDERRGFDRRLAGAFQRLVFGGRCVRDKWRSHLAVATDRANLVALNTHSRG
jgi:hypothetical protein